MKIGEVIQRIESVYSKGVPSKDSRLSPIHVYNMWSTVRSQLLIRKLNKKQAISEINRQVLDCIELIDADPHECNCYPGEICKVKRSKYRIPKIINSLYGDEIMVTSIDGTVKFSKTTFGRSRNILSSKYAMNSKYFYIHNEYLYLMNFRGEIVKIIALFNDLLLVEKFVQKCYTEPFCTPAYDIEFNMDGELLQESIDLTVEKLIPSLKIGVEDATADGRDDPIERTK